MPLTRLAEIVRIPLTARTFGSHRRLTAVFLSAIMVLYMLGEAWLAMRHEPWRDESQAWLIARDASLPDLFGHVLADEGHPALWYLLLMPFAKLGAPYQAMTVISCIVTFAALAVLYCADVPLWVKVLVPFTPMAVYYLPVLSRSYCLVALACALIAACYPDRLGHPWLFAVLIALPFQIHVWMFGFAGMLFLLFAWDLHRVRKPLWPLLAPLISMALAVYELMPRRGDDSYVQLHAPGADLTTFGMAFVLMMICAWFAGWRCGLMASATYGWVLLVLNLLYPYFAPQKMVAFLWMMLAIALMAERDGFERRNPRFHTGTGIGAGTRANHAAANRAPALRAAICLVLTVILAVPMTQRLVSPWYWSPIEADVHGTVSLGAALAAEIDKARTEQPDAVLVPIPDSASIYAASNALPYMDRDVRLWNSMTRRDMTYATDDFRVALHNEVRSTDDLVARTTNAITESGARQAIIIGCGAYGETAAKDQFAADRSFRYVGTVASPNATQDQTRVYAPGFRCDVYLTIH